MLEFIEDQCGLLVDRVRRLSGQREFVVEPAHLQGHVRPVYRFLSFAPFGPRAEAYQAAGHDAHHLLVVVDRYARTVVVRQKVEVVP